MTSSNEKHFPRYWPFVRGIHRSLVMFPTQRPVTRSFDVYFDLRPNKRLSKHSWGWWFETLSCSLWRHRNGVKCRYVVPKRCPTHLFESNIHFKNPTWFMCNVHNYTYNGVRELQHIPFKHFAIRFMTNSCGTPNDHNIMQSHIVIGCKPRSRIRK